MPPIQRNKSLIQEGLSFLRHPFRLLVSGKSLSGKTTIVVQILKQLIPVERWMNIVLISPTSTQHTWDPIRGSITQQIATATDDLLSRIARRQRPRADELTESTLLLVDDSSAELATNRGRKGGLAELGTTARWLNTSMIIMTQNMTSISASFRDNAEALIMFQTLKEDELEVLRKERNAFLGMGRDVMERVYRLATDRPFSFYFQVNTTEGVRSYRNLNELLLVGADGQITVHRRPPVTVRRRPVKHRENELHDFVKVPEERREEGEEEEQLSYIQSFVKTVKSYSPF